MRQPGRGDIPRLREILARHPAALIEPDGLRPAAVLICLIWMDEEWHLLFSQRSMDLPVHSGQISFPGGALEEGETAEDAARRETEEEVGIPRDRIEMIGRLDDVETKSGYIVSPFVGTAPADSEYVLQPSEVVEVYEVPLSALLREDRPEVRYVSWKNRKYPVYSFRWEGIDIWGLTAYMLKGFLDHVRLV
ncbi:MAG: CoA pyrophosphatase [Thermoanaerobaculia bacterium]|nr:CoA pyrophosphatase [Thermoanaerobaculia bacterium]